MEPGSLVDLSYTVHRWGSSADTNVLLIHEQLRLQCRRLTTVQNLPGEKKAKKETKREISKEYTKMCK